MNKLSTLQEILHPMTFEEFEQQYLGKKPCVISSQNSEKYSQLLSLQQFEQTLTSIENGSNLLSHKPSKAHLFNLKGDNGFINKHAVLNGYMAGGTIHLTAIDKMHPPISEYFSELASSLEAHGLLVEKLGDAVVFLTPQNSVALEPHSDPEDLFIFQLEGQKQWHLFGDKPDISAYGSKLSSVPECTMSLTLNPGDVLYIPRGFIHHANTEQSHSLALTLGFKLTSIAKWIKSQIDSVLEDNTELYQPLSEKNLATHSAKIEQCLVQLAATINQQKASTILNSANSEKAQIPIHSLAQANQVNCFNSCTTIKANLVLSVRQSSGKICLFNPITHITGPMAFESIFHWIAEQPGPFCMNDIPGNLDEEFKLGFGKRLLMEGLCQLNTLVESEK